MRKITSILGLSLVLLTASCKQSDYPTTTNTTDETKHYPYDLSVGRNLDLRALGNLVRESKSTEEIERRLNSNGSINRVDLDQDGSIDYLSVMEYKGSNDERGLTFYVNNPDSTRTDIASIDLTKLGDQVHLAANGNEYYYGKNTRYETYYPYHSVYMLPYLISAHRPYTTSYRYRGQPRSVHTTKTTTTTITRKPTTTSSTLPIPKYVREETAKSKANASVDKIDARVNLARNEIRSQKTFTTTSKADSRPNTSGFKSSTSTSRYTPSSTSFKTTTTSRPSTSGFKSSSSSSSYKPSSSSSRSFGSSSKTSYSSSSRSKY